MQAAVAIIRRESLSEWDRYKLPDVSLSTINAT